MHKETSGWAQNQRVFYKQSRVCSYSARKTTVSLARRTSGHSTTPVKRPWKRAGMETVPPVSSTTPALSLYYNRFPLSDTCYRTVPTAFPDVPDPLRTAMETFPSRFPRTQVTPAVLKLKDSVSHVSHDIIITSTCQNLPLVVALQRPSTTPAPWKRLCSSCLYLRRPART